MSLTSRLLLACGLAMTGVLTLIFLPIAVILVAGLVLAAALVGWTGSVTRRAAQASESGQATGYNTAR